MDRPPAARHRWRWHGRPHLRRPQTLAAAAVAAVLLLTLALSSTAADLLRSFSRSAAAGTLQKAAAASCGGAGGDRFLWYAPHSGFSNQVGELRNALLFAAILNRTLIVPPVLDHHAVALGSCPKFRVSSPNELRAAVWDHIMDIVRDRRYVSMGDIIDLSSLASLGVRVIDFRIFASTWCNLNMERACFGDLCCSSTSTRAAAGDTDQCRSLLSGLQVNNNCLYAVEEDCRTTVWTYNQKNDNALDSFQPDEELKKKKKISYVRRRRDLYKALGPGSKAETSAVLAFGTLFTGPYKGSELYIDIHEAPGDPRIQSFLKEIEFLPFAPEIIGAGKEYAQNNIKKPFLCAQLRLLDGQFKNHWKTTFSALKEKLSDLKTEKVSKPVNVFLMTDLPTTNWTGTYLADLAKDKLSYKLHYLHESSNIVVQAARRLMAAEHGLRSGFLPSNFNPPTARKDCGSGQLPDILLHIEESVCSCASLGFVGTAGSTIAENIELMRKNDICKL